MAGIYIHIPFCKQACSYCDFHFSTNLSRKQDVLAAITKEIDLRSDYLKDKSIETIYFGGGTPSLLEREELLILIEKLHLQFTILPGVEITLEANPDELSIEKLKELRNTPVNRLSIGVQSFFDKDLSLMNRAHSAEEAFNSIRNAQALGFENLNVDLIFGAQTTTNEMWAKNLYHFFDLNVPHLSAYSLTIEEKTVLANKIQKRKLSQLDDAKNYEQYLMLQNAINEKGYEQYELSNYCKNEQISKHNTAYWFGKDYLGLGPSAHSFNGNSRQWNIRNNIKYINAINKQEPYFEQEMLSEVDQYHEYLITSLRTKWGVSFDEFRNRFSESIQSHFFKQIKKLNRLNFIYSENELIIRNEYLFTSDRIVSELMI